MADMMLALILVVHYTVPSKTCVKRPLSKTPKIGFQELQVKSIAECSKGSILQYF